MGTCANCGSLLKSDTRGRPQTKYCSRKCHESYRTAAKAAKVSALKQGRICAQCTQPIPVEVSIQAKTCSTKCSVDYQNRRRQEGKRTAWEANKPPCGECGGEIPNSRPAKSKYCSPGCKKKHLDARWRERWPDYMRGYLYGLTPERYAAMLAEQGKRCAICGTAEPGGRSGRWHVDHCHESNLVRGLLCSGCNIGLGHFKDDPERLRAAITYLERSQTQAA